MVLDLLTALAAVILLAQGLGRVFARFHQPPVVGEIVAGLMLGPSLLGWAAPDIQRGLIAPGAMPSLAVIAQLGAVLYMFLVGLDLDGAAVRRRLRATVALSSATIMVPLLGGVVLGFVLYPRFAPPDVAPSSFALFLGVSMSVTAFPVLARILTDRGLSETPLGVLALASAAVADVIAWCLLAVAIGITRTTAGSPITVVATTVSFVIAMVFVVRPLVKRLIGRLDRNRSGLGSIAVGLAGMLLASLITEAAGIHAIFGAFLMGAVIPHDSRLASNLLRLRAGVSTLLLPAYFAFAGLRTDIGLVSGWRDWMLCASIIAVATGGKFAGAFIAAPAAGLRWRHAAAFGALMNTRGLMELIVLNVGLDAGVITPRLFTVLVVMAIATTIATSPLLRWLLGSSPAATPASSDEEVKAVPRAVRAASSTP